MRPFSERPVEQPEPTLIWCDACAGWWWSDTRHDCPGEDPLDAARGIVFSVAACLLVYALLLAAGVIGWRVF